MHILYVIVPLGNGGVEQMIEYWISNLKSYNYKFDIVTPAILDRKKAERFKQLGCNIYLVPYRQRHLLRRYFSYLKIFKINNYDIVHVHTNSCLDFIPLLAARNNGISVRIGHSHASALGNSKKLAIFMQIITRPLFNHLCNIKVSCSQKAGFFLFGKKQDFFLWPNGINTAKFRFNLNYRVELRNKLKLNGKIVLGSVANFMPEKNHLFMLDIFKTISDKNSNFEFLLIGSGPLEKKVKKKVQELNIVEKVQFLGNLYDVYKYYSAMDAFILCSHNEGFSVAFVEAQCNGLRCYIGGNLTEEMDLSESVYRIEDFNSARSWATTILETCSENVEKRKSASFIIRDKGYDIKSTLDGIKRIYEQEGS